MAVVKDPFYSSDARGSVGGLTASMVRGGNIIKKKANPSHQYNPGQNKIRSILGWLSRQWGTLTENQRDSWGAWAIDHPGTDKFGDPFIMSGFNAFVMLNHHAVRFGGGAAMSVLPPTDPPPAALGVLQAVTGVTNPGDVDLSWTVNGQPLVGDRFEIWVAGPFQSAGRKSVESRFIYLTSEPGTGTTHTVADLDEEMWYWFRVRYTGEVGQTTAWGVRQATPLVT